MKIILQTEEYKETALRIAKATWGSIKVAAHHELFELNELPCFLAIDGNEVRGYCYYRIAGDECEIMAIESIIPNKGTGSLLVNAVLNKAIEENCKRLYVNTSNDNTHALRFYQRRGFNMCMVRWDEFDYLRTIKPSIPTIGDDGIPLQHEIELEIIL